MITAQSYREHFLRDGVVAIPDFFAAGELDDAWCEVEQHYASHLDPLPTRPQFDQFECKCIPWCPSRDKDPAFAAMLAHQRLDEITRAIVGDGYSDATCLVQLAPRGAGQAWHQDTPCEDPSQFLVNRLIYPRDVDPRQGSLVYVPGSHQRGRIAPGGNQEPILDEVRLTPKAGTLAFVHSHCFHRVPLNETDRPRISINLRVAPPGVKPGLDRVGVYRGGAYDFATQSVVK